MDAAPVGAGEPYSVCVVGAGGVGALFAARLADAGVTVHCIARGPHLAAIQRRGIAVKSFAGDATARHRCTICLLRRTSHSRRVASPQVRVASATTSPAEVGVVDLVIVALKAWQLQDLDLRPLVRPAPNAVAARQPRHATAACATTASACARRASHRVCAPSRRLRRAAGCTRQVGPRTLVMPTQNGVDAPERLAALVGAEHVVGGYTRVTSLVQGAGAVNHTAIHPALQGTGALPHSGAWVPAELQRCATAWGVRARRARGPAPPAAGPFCGAAVKPRSPAFGPHARPRPQRSTFLRLVVEEDVLLSMWRKLTVMAAYSAVCATARCPIGPVLAAPDARAVLLSCMHETAAVARACGAAMRDADVDACCAVLASLPPGCTPSMQRDILAARPSELDDQAGAVVRIGAQRGVPTPVLGTLYALLQPQERAARGLLVMPAMVEGGGSEPPPLEYYI